MTRLAYGMVTVGSLPGDEGRDPTIEVLSQQIHLPAFSIDVLPYPNDPAQPPLLGIAVQDAGKLCGQRGGRLCTEVEWERVCRGPKGDLFPTGSHWDPTCTQQPEKCLTGFGTRLCNARVDVRNSQRPQSTHERRTHSEASYQRSPHAWRCCGPSMCRARCW
jgi:formylglycine-generating enzyme required for sulfatase activity